MRQITEALKRQIEAHTLTSGDKLPSIRDLTARYQVPYRSVQTAMEHLEQLGLVERIQGSGTYVAGLSPRDAGSSAASNEVYLIFSSQPSSLGPLIQPIITEIQAAGLLPMPIFHEARGELPAHRLEHVLRQWERRPPRAVVLKSSLPALARLVQQHCPPGTRVVTAYSIVHHANRQWDRVGSDEFDMYGLAAQYLLRRGHRRIGLVIGQRIQPRQGIKMTRQFRAPIRGMFQACLQEGLPRALTTHVIPRTAYDPDRLGADPATLERLARWLREKRPTAVVGTAPRLSCLRVAAHQANLRFGEDFEAVGVGDAMPAHRGEYVCIGEQYDRIARHVVDLIRGEPSDAAHHITVPPIFVPRCIHTDPSPFEAYSNRAPANVADAEITCFSPLT